MAFIILFVILVLFLYAVYYYARDPGDRETREKIGTFFINLFPHSLVYFFEESLVIWMILAIKNKMDHTPVEDDFIDFDAEAEDARKQQEKKNIE